MTTNGEPTEGEIPEAEGPTPESRIAALEAEAAQLREQMLRTLAEMENLRRRTEREVKDAGRYAVAGFARDALTVSDNLRRALDAVPADAAAQPALATLVEGMEMTERDFLKVLEKHGVRRIDPTGERFDPNLHQAMFEVPTTEVPSGTVVQVLQSGYVIADRVLRPALVGVAKGGPRPAAAAATEASPEA